MATRDVSTNVPDSDQTADVFHLVSAADETAAEAIVADEVTDDSVADSSVPTLPLIRVDDPDTPAQPGDAVVPGDTAVQGDAVEPPEPGAVVDGQMDEEPSVTSDSMELIPLDPADYSAGVDFDTVITSVHQSFPLIDVAAAQRGIASGNQLAAWGNFDTKFEAVSENTPLGFYETYRTTLDFKVPIYTGGEYYYGYKNGGGSFEPWYEERETNDGGQFKAGVQVPLIRNRDIDPRRAEVWRANYAQQIIDPQIRNALVGVCLDAGLAYWKWVAAGRKYNVGVQWLELARSRNDNIRKRVEAEDLDPPVLVDNERLIAKRQAKLADSLRELQQAAVKLSLYLRDEAGQPIVMPIDDIPDFPPLLNLDPDLVADDIVIAQENRPELLLLDLEMQQLRIDHAEAVNLTLPSLDARLEGSQDVGQPTSSTRDKSEFEIEFGLYYDVPLQRRKGRGKIAAVHAKMAQISAKRRLVNDKVGIEVRSVYAGLIQTRQEVLQAREAVRLASQIAAIERRKFELGESDLLKVALREQSALDAQVEAIIATQSHFQAFSHYAATLAYARPSSTLLPADK